MTSCPRATECGSPLEKEEYSLHLHCKGLHSISPIRGGVLCEGKKSTTGRSQIARSDAPLPEWNPFSPVSIPFWHTSYIQYFRKLGDGHRYLGFFSSNYFSHHYKDPLNIRAITHFLKLSIIVEGTNEPFCNKYSTQFPLFWKWQTNNHGCFMAHRKDWVDQSVKNNGVLSNNHLSSQQIPTTGFSKAEIILQTFLLDLQLNFQLCMDLKSKPAVIIWMLNKGFINITTLGSQSITVWIPIA